MQDDRTRRRAGHPRAPVTRILTLLLVILCLTECTSGSCLSYGHSCWGAHGKRSGKPPVTAPDWFLNKLFRRMDTNNEMNHARQEPNDDMNAIYQEEVPNDSLANRLGSSSDVPLELAINRNPEAKPMLDEDLISKIKFWQLMRDAPEEK